MFQHYLLNKLLNTTSLFDSTVAKLLLVASLLYTELLYCQSICIPRACEMYKVTTTAENLISDHYQHKINLPWKRVQDCQKPISPIRPPLMISNHHITEQSMRAWRASWKSKFAMTTCPKPKCEGRVSDLTGEGSVMNRARKYPRGLTAGKEFVFLDITWLFLLAAGTNGKIRQQEKD
jgi:hypothetical protein